jgi:hypothetical protein
MIRVVELRTDMDSFSHSSPNLRVQPHRRVAGLVGDLSRVSRDSRRNEVREMIGPAHLSPVFKELDLKLLEEVGVAYVMLNEGVEVALNP